jgi:hypothetical protein
MPAVLPPDAIPVRQHDFEQHPDGLVTVLVPKFTSPLSRRLLVPLLAKPNIRMHLDAEGSAVWTGCDGRTTLRQLAVRVQERFGGTADEARTRVERFLLSLSREGSVTFIAPAGSVGPT